MALFKRDFNKPGPGVPKNAPRKKGFARFFEVLGRDMGNLFKLNLLHALCLLPAQLCFFLASIAGGGNLFFILLGLGIVTSAPVGPSKTALSYCISKMLRDDPGFLWHDYKRIFKENFKGTFLFGVLYSCVVAAQFYAVLLYTANPNMNFLWVAVFLLSVLIFIIASPYYFLQAPYLQLRSLPLIKNSMLLSLGYLPRSLAGGLISAALLVLQVLAFPLTIPITLIAGYAIPNLILLMWIWPPVDKTFKIEATLAARNAGEADPAAPGEDEGAGAAQDVDAEEDDAGKDSGG